MAKSAAALKTVETTSIGAILSQLKVPIKDLRFGHDPECGMNINARRTDREAGVPELAERIREYGGVFQSLVVCHGPDGAASPLYFVADGNRRLAGLHIVFGAKSSVEVAATLVTRDRALEISQTAAESSVPVHPIDQFQTFFDLTQPPYNLTMEQIAARFLISDPKFVRQRLALGGLSKKVIDAWRSGDLGEQAAVAFTLAPDVATQERVFDKLAANNSLQPRTVRAEITGTDQDVGRFLKLVGLEKYKDAGGDLFEDLFGDKHGVSDAALLMRMVDAHIATLREGLLTEGWAWADMEDKLPATHHSWDRIDWNDKHKFTKAERERSGVVLRISHETGELIQVRGIIRPETGAKKSASTKKDGQPQESDGLSNALRQRMGDWMTLAAASAVEKLPDYALTLACAALSSRLTPVVIVASGLGSDKLKEDTDFAKLVGRIAGRPVKQRQEMLAKLVGAALNLRTDDEDAQAVASDMEDTFVQQMQDVFKKNAGDYFGSVQKSMSIAAIRECDAKMEIDEAQPRAKIAEIATKVCVKAGWLPPELRTSSYSGPQASKPKSAAKKK